MQKSWRSSEWMLWSQGQNHGLILNWGCRKMDKIMDKFCFGAFESWKESWKNFALGLLSHGKNHGQFSKRGSQVMGKIMEEQRFLNLKF